MKEPASVSEISNDIVDIARKALREGHVPKSWGSNHYVINNRVYPASTVIEAYSKEYAELLYTTGL